MVTTFIETIFEDSKKLKALEIMYRNTSTSVFVNIAKFAYFR